MRYICMRPYIADKKITYCSVYEAERFEFFSEGAHTVKYKQPQTKYTAIVNYWLTDMTFNPQQAIVR